MARRLRYGNGSGHAPVQSVRTETLMSFILVSAWSQFLVCAALLAVAGSRLSHVSPLHAVTALPATIMSNIAIVGLLYRPRTRLFGTVGWASLHLLVVYLFNSLVLYSYGE